MNLDLTLRFAKLRLMINHAQIVNLGSFSVFCMKAISEGLSIDQISQLTLLKEDLIIEQLKFAREREYLTKDNQLTKKGDRLINILNFLERYSGKFYFYVDLYTEQTSIQAIYLEEELKRFPQNGKNFIEQVLKFRGTLKLVNEKFDKDIYRYFLISMLPDEEKLIKEEWQELEFSCEFVELQDFTLPFNLERFMKSLSFDEINKGIKIYIPFVTFKLILNPISDCFGKSKFYTTITEIIPPNQSFNLLNGKLITSEFKETEQVTQNKIEPLIDICDVLNQDGYPNIPLNLLYYTEIKPEIREGFATAHIYKQVLHTLINDVVRGSDN